MHVDEQARVRGHVSSKKRIYVVDDERMIAHTLCLILQKFGYDASMFFDAESALEAVQRTAPDLVLSDIVMAGEMNGVDLAETLAGTHPSVQVMLISGHGASAESLRRAQTRGFSPEVRAKPIAPKELLTDIARLLDSRVGELARNPWPLSRDAVAMATAAAPAFTI